MILNERHVLCAFAHEHINNNLCHHIIPVHCFEACSCDLFSLTATKTLWHCCSACANCNLCELHAAATLGTQALGVDHSFCGTKFDEFVIALCQDNNIFILFTRVDNWTIVWSRIVGVQQMGFGNMHLVIGNNLITFVIDGLRSTSSSSLTVMGSVLSIVSSAPIACTGMHSSLFAFSSFSQDVCIGKLPVLFHLSGPSRTTTHL